MGGSLADLDLAALPHLTAVVPQPSPCRKCSRQTHPSWGCQGAGSGPVPSSAWLRGSCATTAPDRDRWEIFLQDLAGLFRHPCQRGTGLVLRNPLFRCHTLNGLSCEHRCAGGTEKRKMGNKFFQEKYLFIPKKQSGFK